MKLNISNPAIGSQLCLDIDDEKKLRAFYDKRMGQEVMGEDVSEEFNGYVFRITGGNDKQYVFFLCFHIKYVNLRNTRTTGDSR